MARIAEEIFAANPMHPAHHYVIHLWDRRKPENGLDSAALCGPSAPAIAHMWHMPGHIHSKLKRYREATWYQEASARVDHAHMIKYHLLPDQIHNFAHNNEWLIRNLRYIGRCDDAVSLAKNMIELPRVPKFKKSGDDSSYDPAKSSWKHGRRHLKDTLFLFEQWQELLALEDTPFLKPDKSTIYQSDLDKYFGIAKFETGDLEGGRAILQKSKEGSNLQRELSIYEALNSDPPDLEKAKSLLPRLKSVPKIRHALLWHRAGDLQKAADMSRDAVKSTPNQVLPLAIHVQLLHAAGRTEDAKKAFTRLRTTGGTADPDLPAFKPLASIAKEFGFPEKWQIPASVADDPGPHPELESLGPFRWSPPKAPDFALQDHLGNTHQLCERKGKATLLIFYLGSGCLHCMEQLSEFAPAKEKYKKAGIDIVAVSTDSPAGLAETYAITEEGSADKTPFPFPLLSDSSLETFKKYRAFDDFEDQPLHGTFLIDKQGHIRWQDIGFEPLYVFRLVTGGMRSPAGYRSINLIHL